MYVCQTRAVCPQGTGPFVKDSALTLRSLSMYTAAFSQTEHERQAKKTSVRANTGLCLRLRLGVLHIY